MLKRFLFPLVLLILFSCSEDDTKKEVIKTEVFCDAETVSDNKFIAGDHVLENAWGRTTKKARSGKYSVALNKDCQYGMSYDFEGVKKGDALFVQVWRHLSADRGVVVISDKSDNAKQYVSNGSIIDKEGDWGLIQLRYVADNDYDVLQVYLFNPNEQKAYFDDLKINYYQNTDKPDENFKALEIDIPQSAYDSLARFRKQALKQEVITKDLKEYVRASVKINGKKVPVDLRLKGDWTDHLESNKWSFRIKIAGDESYKGMKKFSIQNPSTRSFMKEWFAHKVFEREDVLTTRYEFVPIIINGEKKGVFALEEHFDKQLLEHRKRREAPIVKFDESGIWQVHYEYKKTGKIYLTPEIQSAEIIPFKKNKTFKSPVLSKQFYAARSNMIRFRDHDPEVDEYMDVESMAKFIALSDILNGKHGQVWHNQRHYFNPITSKLEPIAFDCFMEESLVTYEAFVTGFERKQEKDFSTVVSALSNEVLHERYVHYLKKYSGKGFLKKAFKELEKEIREAEKMLSFEYPEYKFEQFFFENNRKQIEEILPKYLSFASSKPVEKSHDPHFQILPSNTLFEGIALKAYTESVDESAGVKYHLENFHSADLEVIGYTVKGDKKNIRKCNSVVVKGYTRDGKVDKKTLQLPVKARRIYYRAKNCGDKQFVCKPSKWSSPGILRSISDEKIAVAGSVYEIKGKHKYTKNLVIPAGKKVVIHPGAKLDFTNGASFVSYSPIEINGTQQDIVEIGSSDGTGQGFTVLAQGKESKLTFATFHNLNTVNKKNWSLTGAVTFYEGKVSIENCVFEDNNCEDGLNLIRCSFTMKNSTVRNTKSDGFDADFCTGKLSNSLFFNTGNDCIDFSGSRIEIAKCVIKKAGDKGISGGEGSNLTVRECEVDGAYIAVASKDFSVVKTEGLAVSNSKYGFAAYRKKPEYGPAKIVAKNTRKMLAKELHLLEKGSKLSYKGKNYVGTKKFDIDAMYAMYEK